MPWGRWTCWTCWTCTLGCLLLALQVFPAGTSHAQRNAPSCMVLSLTGPTFDGYDRFSPTPNDSTGNLTFQCDSLGGTSTIVIEMGRGHKGTVDREMKSRNQRLSYNLYVDAARTRIWGDGERGTSVRSVTPAPGVAVRIPIYGRVPSRQNVAPGIYSDRVRLVMQY